MTTKGSHWQAMRSTLAMGFPILCFVTLWLAVESAGASAAVQASGDEPIIIGTTWQPYALDPADAYDIQSWEILNNVGTGLLTYAPGTDELVPGLATAMPQISADGLVYTFTLRSGLYFPDGTPFDAVAVKWSIDRVMALGGSPSGLVSYYVAGVQAVDSQTARFTLQFANAGFPVLTALPPFFPVSPNCLPADQLAPESTCGGIGPYTIEDFVAWDSMRLEANPGFFGLPPRTASIFLRFDYDYDPDALRQSLDLGEIDVAWPHDAMASYLDLKGDPDYIYVKGGGASIRYLCFNTTTPPFDNADVRTALAAAMHREPVARDVYSDTVYSLYSMVPGGVWSHRPSFFDAYGQRDLATAITLLEQAGYSETNPLPIDLWYPYVHYGPEVPDMMAALAAQFAESGMISVTLHGADWPDYVDAFLAGNLPAFLLGWYPDYLDAENYTWPFAHSSSSAGLGIFYDNPAMDALLEAAQVTLPVRGAGREAIFHDVQDLWVGEAPTIPLFQVPYLAVGHARIRDIVLPVSGLLPYATMWRDTSVGETMGTGGGRLTSYDGSTTIDVPPGALTDTIILTHTPAFGPGPGGNLASLGLDFELSAVYSSTGEPAHIAPGYTYSITVHYAETDLGAIIEESLGLYRWDDGADGWTQDGILGSADTSQDLVHAEVDRFGLFAILGETNRLYLPLVIRGH